MTTYIFIDVSKNLTLILKKTNEFLSISWSNFEKFNFDVQSIKSINVSSKTKKFFDQYIMKIWKIYFHLKKLCSSWKSNSHKTFREKKKHQHLYIFIIEKIIINSFEIKKSIVSKKENSKISKTRKKIMTRQKKYQILNMLNWLFKSNEIFYQKNEIAMLEKKFNFNFKL